MKSTTYVSLDLQRPNFQTVYAVQNDVASRWVTATIRDGSSIWEPPSGVLVTIRYRRADGVGGFYDELEDGTTAYTINADDTVTFGLAGAALEVAGTGQAEVNFYNAQGEKLTTAAFVLQVLPSSYDDNEIITSDPYINVLQQQIADVLEAAGDITGLTATASTLTAGSDATVTVTGGTGGTPYNLAFGIPRGPTGPQGPTGPTGNNWPVGSLYWTLDATFVPGDTFGGTWVRVKDTFVYAAGDSDSIGDTGGVATHDLRQESVWAGVGFVDATHLGLDTPDPGQGQTALSFTPTHESAGMSFAYGSDSTRAARLGGTLDNMPPYLVAYCWKRTA